ncbi:hypothetical protein PHSY_000024 [Pseudozyma hubeiensis SY62]|uniref:Sm domain-containing protein n=2 Tax=Ustilaginaceae TaxID=5268 RepID=R9NVM9_PSEHS|nr:hypothetical protein PHSY_000024 [Pseudozyma hubeiensis SY62]GAC92471.1 hypothetical protein PHSY_000024 [Pseudozyma hubeiensis SY62]
MLIFSAFKTLTGQQVTIELKNDLAIQGTLKSVDQFLNFKIDNIRVLDEAKHPHMMAVKSAFIRGSVVRYVHIPAAAVDTQLLEDATRRGSRFEVQYWRPHIGAYQFFSPMDYILCGGCDVALPRFQTTTRSVDDETPLLHRLCLFNDPAKPCVPSRTPPYLQGGTSLAPGSLARTLRTSERGEEKREGGIRRFGLLLIFPPLNP